MAQVIPVQAGPVTVTEPGTPVASPSPSDVVTLSTTPPPPPPPDVTWRDRKWFLGELVSLAFVHFWAGVFIGTTVDAVLRRGVPELAPAPEGNAAAAKPKPDKRNRGLYVFYLSISSVVLVVLCILVRSLLNQLHRRIFHSFQKQPVHYDTVTVHMGFAMVFGVGCSSPTSAAMVKAVFFGE